MHEIDVDILYGEEKQNEIRNYSEEKKNWLSHLILILQSGNIEKQNTHTHS